MYHDMHTGRWWWTTQVRILMLSFASVSCPIWNQEKPDQDCPGATVIPIIISTDKTQLTLFKNKTVYPLYLVFAGPVCWTGKKTEIGLNPTAKDRTTGCGCTNSEFFRLPVAMFVKKSKNRKKPV